MAWIESHQQLLNHPKVMDLSAAMGWDVDVVIGKLHRLWWWCIDYAEDGDLRKHREGRIAAAMNVPVSDAKKLVKELVEAGWIDSEPYLRIHDWWDYAGKYLQGRYKRSPELWQAIRAKYITTPENGGEQPEIGTGSAAGVALDTVPNRTVPDHTVPSTGTPSDKKEYAEHVHMTEGEYAKLIEKLGAEIRVKRAIEILNNYKGANGKRYKSDYLAILNWVIERLTKEERENTGANWKGSSTGRPSQTSGGSAKATGTRGKYDGTAIRG